MTASFHEGECALQAETGALERLAQVGPRFLRDHLPEQHREFYPLLPFLLAGSVDAGGQPWASVLAGPPGFVHSPDPQQLRIDALPADGDPLHASLVRGAALGLLGVQPHTRRRNRMNGRVSAIDANGFTVAVGQSFGNCPKYIHPREPRFVHGTGAPGAVQRSERLAGEALALVASADTFFIASAHPQAPGSAAPAHGVDVSHRGGPAGFVRVADGGRELTVPDYVGNFYFNTLGNLLLEPRCGLLFMDFANGTLLQVAAHARVDRDAAAASAVPGAQRLLRLRVDEVRLRPRAVPLAWSVAQL